MICLLKKLSLSIVRLIVKNGEIMRVLLSCSLFLVLSLNVEAQKMISFSGSVVNAESEALAGANVVLYDAADSSLITGKAADAKGMFEIKTEAVERCYIEISYLGYQTQTLGFLNMRENQQLGKITLEASELTTAEVEVIGSQQKRELDRIIVYPDRVQVRQSATALDLLSNMMLAGLNINTADLSATAMEKAVEFRVNGRKVTIQDVHSLTSSNIRKVEYIDTPGLEYGREVGAVVNLVTKEPVSGFATSGSLMNALYVEFGNDFLNARWNHKKSEFGVSYNTMFRKYKKRKTDQTQRYLFPDGGDIVCEYIGENTPFKSQTHNLTLSYNLMEKDNYVFSAIGRMAYEYYDRRQLSHIYENGIADGRQANREKVRDLMPELDLYFAKQLTDKQDVSINVVGGYAGSTLDYAYQEEEAEGQTPYATLFDADGDRYNLIGEAKYNYAFSKRHNFSVGVKDRYIWEKDRYADKTDVRKTRNNYLYAYAQMAGGMGNFNYNVGLSGAMSRYSRRDRDFSFWSFQPMVTLGYRFSRNSMLRYRLEVSSNDPKIAQLNDVRQVVNPYLYSRGNPDLSAYYQLENSLNYTWNLKRLYLQVSGYHFREKKPIAELISYDTSSGMFRTDYRNQGSLARYSLSVFGRYRGLFNNILTLATRVQYSHFKSEGIGYKHHLNHVNAEFQVNATYKNFSLLWVEETRFKYLTGEYIYNSSLASRLLLQYNRENFTVGVGMLHPFNRQWDAGNEMLSKVTPRKSWTSIRDNGRMLFVRFTWNFSAGRKYKPGSKDLNNATESTGLSTMPQLAE